MFLLALIAITVFTAALPLFVREAGKWYPFIHVRSRDNWIPLLASWLFLGSFFLPDIRISSHTNTFQQHFVGGGVFSALLFVYLANILGWRPHPIVGLIGLIAWTSTLGVGSELAEFALNHLGILAIDTSDTDWDLVANTSGALTGYAVISAAFRTVRTSRTETTI